MQKIKLKTEESGKKLLEAYAPPKWSETADDDDDRHLAALLYINSQIKNMICLLFMIQSFMWELAIRGW